MLLVELTHHHWNSTNKTKTLQHTKVACDELPTARVSWDGPLKWMPYQINYMKQFH